MEKEVDERESGKGREGEKHYPQTIAEKQQGYQNSVLLILLLGLAIWKLDMLFTIICWWLIFHLESRLQVLNYLRAECF